MTDPIRIRVRTNFDVNSRSISHEQTVEVEMDIKVLRQPDGYLNEPLIEVEMGEGYTQEWSAFYADMLEQARKVAAAELERRKAQFLAQVVA